MQIRPSPRQNYILDSPYKIQFSPGLSLICVCETSSMCVFLTGEACL